ncbi:hypothetical protein [Lactococcus fujiensis]|nr:hypothetical protein [Lactococcus fujiensis]
MTENIEQLRLSEIVKNPYQPRVVFDEGKFRNLPIPYLKMACSNP